MTKGQLERRFLFKRDRRMIHLLIFVHAATDPLPTALLRTIRAAVHQEGLRGKRVKTTSITVIYKLAVLVIALKGHAGLYYMTGEEEPIMADP